MKNGVIMFLYLHEPRRTHANPPNPRQDVKSTREPIKANSYPDYEQSYVFEGTHEPEDNHVTGIDI